MRLIYHKQVPSLSLDQSDFKDWERFCLPLGNGYFGACLFSLSNIERIQISDKTIANPYDQYQSRNCGLQSFGDIFIEFGHNNVKEYVRELSLDDALLTSSYIYNGVRYNKCAFISYPDNVLVYKVAADKKKSISFKIRFSSPFDGCITAESGRIYNRKTTIKYNQDYIDIEGFLDYTKIEINARIDIVLKGGAINKYSDYLEVLESDEVLILFSMKTNYILNENIFLESDYKKKIKTNPYLKNEIDSHQEELKKKTYEELLQTHLNDYRSLYKRVDIDIEQEPNIDTDILLKDYQKGKRSQYLETLLFQYGRYLLISSSRKGTLPAHLQGAWTAYQSSPWSAGYWHNINLQMNYWGCWSSNIQETFESYINYANAYFKQANKLADDYIKELYPERYEENNNGWTIGTGAWPYHIEKPSTNSHSGPGTGAFTSLLFWEHYCFTQDKQFLKDIAYPFLFEMSIFLEKCLIKDGESYLVKYSASPENVDDPNIWNSYHKTKGCAFDQQMVYENFDKTIKAAEILNIKNSFIDKIRKILPHLDNIIIGESGQIKEYREEKYYSDIGEPHHRHISQLVALYPGTQINNATPQYLKAAEFTLNARGDQSNGWAMIHRLLAWCRIKNPNRVDDLLKLFIANNIMDNLWDSHPPFQIDGNLGYVASICEMLVQSQNGSIDLLPSLPSSWSNGYFKGIRARGNFEIECEFINRQLVKAVIISLSGNDLVIKNKDYLIIKDGKESILENQFITLKTNVNERIVIKKII